MVEDEVIAKQLEALLTPVITAQENYYRQLGVRDRILNLPLMVAAVLTLLWRDVPGVTELTRMLAREGFLWCSPTQVTQQAVSKRFLTFPAKMYAEADKGHPPVPPAQLELTVIRQAYTKASDAEAIEALTMDRRWQLVLDCLDCEQAPFSQATLVRFRQALMIHQLDRRLIERTVEFAFQTKKFGGRQLRAALDSSPLWGAAKGEDTSN